MMDSLDDDFDPLAPVHVVDDADAEPEAPGGIGDPGRIVHVWFDDDGELTRVQLSPIWHRRLGHRTLSDVFDGVLAAARVRVAPPAPEEGDPTEGVDFSALSRFGRDPLQSIQLALENLGRRWQEAADRQRTHPARPPAPVVVGDEESVMLQLDQDGHPIHVEFDEEWLDEAEVSEITDTVIRLARQARARFVPVDDGRDELADLAREHEILMDGFRRMLAGGGRR